MRDSSSMARLRLAGIRTSRRTFGAAVAAGFMSGLSGCDRFSGRTYHGIRIDDVRYASNFRLPDSTGRIRQLSDFRGRAVLMFFGFTQCPDVCPTALARAAEVRRLLGQQADELQVIFVTLDPERDTPDVLKAYTAGFDPTFLGLHGDLVQTAATAREFRVFYKKVPTASSYTLDHSTFSYLYDTEGRLRLLMRHDMTAAQYAQDVLQLLRST
ncbi:SCO family protein [uncultured Xylophilus sp.]|uniref:SCO family protein n=1 Tax=uncultured Xylophilus sp. TaxID=296832 RepID=UPI0025D09850|nr:SCO family protein [uncultured Xylophilus sp.]